MYKLDVLEVGTYKKSGKAAVKLTNIWLKVEWN